MDWTQVPHDYKDGWFDFDRAVPCWIQFATEKACKIVLSARQRDFRASVKPKVQYAARLLYINAEHTHVSVDFPELQGIADGLDVTFAVPTPLPTRLTTAGELAEVARWAGCFGMKLSGSLTWTQGPAGLTLQA